MLARGSCPGDLYSKPSTDGVDEHLMNIYSDLLSCLVSYRVEFPELEMVVLPPFFVSAYLQEYFSLLAFEMHPVGWDKGQSPAREHKLMGKHELYLTLTFSSVETVSCGKFFCSLGAGQNEGRDIMDVEVQIFYHLLEFFFFFNFSVAPELCHLRIWVLGYSWQ